VTRRALVIALAAGLFAGEALGQTADTLAAGFENPPASAKPRVWWHWIDGNVSKEGIRKDLDWLHEIGVGGVHQFDVALNRDSDEPLVAERAAYLSRRWRDLIRYAVTQADGLGMEFTIAASPGWSESGGPWVQPRQGMKKFVWSETTVEGGRRFTEKLPQPPSVTGPFQNVPFAPDLSVTQQRPPEYYADAAVVAYRAPVPEALDGESAASISSSAGAIDAERLADGDVAHAIELAYGNGQTAWIQIAYTEPRRIQAATIAVERPDAGTPSDRATGGAIWLEASDDGGSFRRVADLPRGGAPEQTIAFAPVTARVFRLVLERPVRQPSTLELLGLPQAPAPTAHRIAEFVLHSAPRVDRFEDKAGFSTRAIAATEDTPAVEPREAIAKRDVVDLTEKLRPDGTLDWVPPSGRWVVLRFGYSLTGETNHPASREGTGLEVDKLNREDVKAYFDAFIAKYERALGADMIGRHGLEYMVTDSYEAGVANWTDDVLEQFEKRRGYDPRPWLPVLAGRVVVSSAASDRFLWDFRRTLGDLIADAHYGELSELLHERGMGRYGESHENGRAFIGDGMQVKKSADVPMGALWVAAPWPHVLANNADIRESASVAHIYGQNLVAAESLTAFGNSFSYTPETLKPFADRELAMGLNRFVIHTSVHQPDDRLGPGATLGPFGQWFTRHETWAADAAPWISYLARSSFLLQQGRFVADIAYLYGEGNNVTNLFGNQPPPIPAGYNFDFINADALVNALAVSDGTLTTPGGTRYRILALDDSTRRMSLPVLRKLKALVEAGATVVGPRPEMTPSLADDESEFDAIVEQLWGSAANRSREGTVSTEPLAAALKKLAIAPDCQFGGAAELNCVHRALPDADLYYVASGSAEPHEVEASFRVTGKAAEIWRADTGERTPASYRIENGRTIVPLDLEAHDAVFVVFRQPASEPSRTVPRPVSEVVATVDGPWDVTFAPEHGAPAGITRFDTLSSWTTHTEPGIKYFSGTASYVTTLDVSGRWIGNGAHIRLDLGDVKNVAEVSVDGRTLGVLWKKPFAIDVTDALHPGENRLEVKVTNVWPNRMIGDHQPGAERIAYSTFDPFEPDSPLLSAGLLGPVVVERLSER
jgi:hypothetical protein